MARRTGGTVIDLARRLGCWAIGLFVVALFFALGALVSLFTWDIGTMLQAVIVAGGLAAVGVWTARSKKAKGKSKK